MIEAVFILDVNGRPLITKQFRRIANFTEIPLIFSKLLLENKHPETPFLVYESNNLLYHLNKDVYLVATTKQDINCCLVFDYLNSLVSVLVHEFIEFDQESVMRNFVLVLKIISNSTIYGYPKIIETYDDSFNNSIRSNTTFFGSETNTSKINSVSWRNENITYNKNEVFLDVYENLNLVLDSQGSIINAHLMGRIIVRSNLTGIPECLLKFNEKIIQNNKHEANNVNNIENCQFHRCVDTQKIDSNQTIRFIPPDGKFELMNYQAPINEDQLPFKIITDIRRISEKVIIYRITVMSNYSASISTSNFEARIPVPQNTKKANLDSSIGKAKFITSSQVMSWKVKKFPGNCTHTFNAEIDISKNENNTVLDSTDINIMFEIIAFAVSGLKVKFLKVFEKNGYRSIKWIKYITRTEKYQIKI